MQRLLRGCCSDRKSLHDCSLLQAWDMALKLSEVPILILQFAVVITTSSTKDYHLC